MASSSKLSYWFFRDVGFARKLSTGVYFAAKPWIVMGVAVYAGTHLLGYKMERTGHAVEDDHLDVDGVSIPKQLAEIERAEHRH